MAFKEFKILQNILLDKILSDYLYIYNSQLGSLLNSELLKTSMASRQSKAISFHLIAMMINQLI